MNKRSGYSLAIAACLGMAVLTAHADEPTRLAMNNAQDMARLEMPPVQIQERIPGPGEAVKMMAARLRAAVRKSMEPQPAVHRQRVSAVLVPEAAPMPAVYRAPREAPPAIYREPEVAAPAPQSMQESEFAMAEAVAVDDANVGESTPEEVIAGGGAETPTAENPLAVAAQDSDAVAMSMSGPAVAAGPPTAVPVVEPQPVAESVPAMVPASPSVEQRLAELAQRRARGELSGEAYLVQRHVIIHGVRPQPAPAPVVAKAGPTVEQQLAVLKEKRLRGEINGDQYLAERRRVIYAN